MTYTWADHDATPKLTCNCANCQGIGPEGFPKPGDWKHYGPRTPGMQWPTECPPEWEGLAACQRCTRFHTQPWCQDGTYSAGWGATA